MYAPLYKDTKFNKAFEVEIKTESAPVNKKKYTLESNDYDEIFILISGNPTIIIEGAHHTDVTPYDIFLINRNEFHHVLYNTTDESCKRIEIKLKDDFYKSNNCEVFKEVFSDKCKNVLPSTSVKTSGMLDCIVKLVKYTQEDSVYNDIMVRCTIIEILYHIGKLVSVGTNSKDNISIQILDYINKNISGKITLDAIAAYFFISKCHLCRIFKLATGLTVTQYISAKRISLTEDLFRQGKNITDACLEAGFGSYTNFYKTYVKEKGCSPRYGLSEIKSDTFT